MQHLNLLDSDLLQTQPCKGAVCLLGHHKRKQRMSLAKGQAELAVELCHQSLQGFTSSSAMATLERQEIPFNLMWPPLAVWPQLGHIPT